MKDKISLETLVAAYKAEYLRTNGKEPNIGVHKSAFWIYINGDATRKFALPGLIEILKGRPDYVAPHLPPTTNMLGEVVEPQPLTMTREGNWLVLHRGKNFIGYIARNGWSGKSAFCDYPLGEPVLGQLSSHISLKEMIQVVKECESYFA